MSINSSNVLNFTQPITQTMNSSTGNYSGGSQQSLNLSYFVPINTGGTQTIGGAPAGPPQVTANGTPSYPPAGGGGYSPPAYPSTPSYPPAPAYPTPQQPVYQAPIIQPSPVFLLPQQPVQQNNTNISSIVNLLVNIINQVQSNNQQVQQPPQQDNNNFMQMLLMILLLKKRGGGGHAEEAPPPAPAPAPKPAPPPAPKPTPKVTIDTDTTNFKETAQTVAKKGSPLTLDLNGDGVKTSTNKVNFDINGDGAVDTINDISADDGVLTIDSDGDGTSGSSGKELLGDNTDLSRFGIQGKFADGFDALRAIADDAKAKGLIDGDDVLSADELKTLEKEYGLKIKNGSVNAESASITNSGISAINLATGEKVRSNNFDGQGNDTLKQGGATFTKADGTEGNYEDIFFAY